MLRKISLFGTKLFEYSVSVVTGSGAVGLAHLDGSCTDDCVINMVLKVQEFSLGVQGRLELHLIGGFSDVQNYSEDLFFAIMRK